MAQRRCDSDDQSILNEDSGDLGRRNPKVGVVLEHPPGNDNIEALAVYRLPVVCIVRHDVHVVAGTTRSQPGVVESWGGKRALDSSEIPDHTPNQRPALEAVFGSSPRHTWPETPASSRRMPRARGRGYSPMRVAPNGSRGPAWTRWAKTLYDLTAFSRLGEELACIEKRTDCDVAARRLGANGSSGIAEDSLTKTGRDETAPATESESVEASISPIRRSPCGIRILGPS